MSSSSLADVTSSLARSELRVADAMHWGLVKCPPDASLRAVAALMSDHQVHCVVVVDESSDGQFPWGIVSDLDLVAAATVRSLDDQEAGGTAMSPAVTVAPGELLERAAERITRHGVSHLLVVDPVRRRPLGVLSTLDLAGVMAAAWSPTPGANPYFPAPDPRREADIGKQPPGETRGTTEGEPDGHTHRGGAVSAEDV